MAENIHHPCDTAVSRVCGPPQDDVDVIVIGGVSTLFFNGNPLLKFDGYYVLADLLEIPNLASRANKYILYLIQRYAFAMEGLSSPVTARGEAPRCASSGGGEAGAEGGVEVDAFPRRAAAFLEMAAGQDAVQSSC